MDVDEHLFRREAGRMVSALTRIFGVHNLALAEDVVQDAFCRALEVWGMRGLPDNPSAWLMATARNRALDILRRQRTANTFAPELGRLLESEWTLAPAVDEILGADFIQDSALRMMFSCCHARLSEAAQVALILNILCGFSVYEIAVRIDRGNSGADIETHRGRA
jgi:RNA polymerase sigma-70 factor (ECF subfamily)